MPEPRPPRPGGEGGLGTFPARPPGSALVLRSNARAAGPVDRGAPGQAAAGVAAGQVRCRHPEPAELDLVVRWRVDFSVEALGATDAPALETACRADALLLQERGAGWLLLDGVTPVAYSAFNAMLPEIVQIGGVWTPPALRGRGYARAVVAGSLVAAHQQNAQRAVLFADPLNQAAQRAYLSIGFRIVGDYGLVLFG